MDYQRIHQILTQTSEEISVSEQQLPTDNYTDIGGSSIAYTFPIGSTSLIYRFRFNLTWNNENNRGDTISEYQLQISRDDGSSWDNNPLKTFRLRNSVFSENFATIEDNNVNATQDISALATINKFHNKISVPELRGLSIRKALHTLEEHDLKFRLNGNGEITWQNPIPGTIVKKGTVCIVGLQ